MSSTENEIKKEIITKTLYDYDKCIHQGDFLKDVKYLENFREENGNIEVSLINFPLVTILTQECDATQDYNNRTRNFNNPNELNHQYLLSVIAAPVYNLEDIREGTHLENLNLRYNHISSNELKRIKQNRESRYHYMKIEILPSKYIEYVIDFKHYFTINVEQAIKYKSNKDKFQFTLDKLFKESVSQRFANYLSRIGLPESDVE